MGNGYAEPKRLILGPGDLYINDVFVGQVKGGIEFKYTPTYAFQRPGNSLVDIKGVRTSEMCTLSAKICDFKVAQLRRAMGINQAIFSGSLNLRYQDVLKLSATSAITLSKTAVGGTMKVSKLDRATVYVSSTDYSATASTITRKSGSITAGQVVIVEYDYLDATGNAVQVGGEKTDVNTFELNFVHDLSNGKKVQITLWKAMAISDISLLFDEKSSGNYTLHDIVFKGLADLTRTEGKNLFEIIEEAPTTAS